MIGCKIHGELTGKLLYFDYKVSETSVIRNVPCRYCELCGCYYSNSLLLNVASPVYNGKPVLRGIVSKFQGKLSPEKPLTKTSMEKLDPYESTINYDSILTVIRSYRKQNKVGLGKPVIGDMIIKNNELFYVYDRKFDAVKVYKVVVDTTKCNKTQTIGAHLLADCTRTYFLSRLVDYELISAYRKVIPDTPNNSRAINKQNYRHNNDITVRFVESKRPKPIKGLRKQLEELPARKTMSKNNPYYHVLNTASSNAMLTEDTTRLPSANIAPVSVYEQYEYETEEGLVRRAPFQIDTTIQYIPIYVNRGTLRCHREQHYIHNVSARVFTADKKGTVLIPVQQCLTCKPNFFFIGQEALDGLEKAYGELLFVKAIDKPTSPSVSLNGDFSVESEIHRLGYNVNATTGLSDSERQSILFSAISEHGIPKSEIIHHLEKMIQIRVNIPSMSDAIDKWERDLAFLYSLKDSGIVYDGYLTRHRDK